MDEDSGKAAMIVSGGTLVIGTLCAGIAAPFGYLQLGGAIAFICGALGLFSGREGLLLVFVEVIFKERTFAQGLRGCLTLGVFGIGNLVLAVGGIVLIWMGSGNSI